VIGCVVRFRIRAYPIAENTSPTRERAHFLALRAGTGIGSYCSEWPVWIIEELGTVALTITNWL
jgi:hypothetical protein